MVIVIIIITYNYWNLLDRNSQLRDRLISSEEKLSDLNDKKASLEKQEASAQDKLKTVQDNLEQARQALQKKDSEIDELNTKLKTQEQDNEKITLDLADLKEKFAMCQNRTSKLDELQEKYDRKLNENNELKLNLSLVEEKLQKPSNPVSTSCTQAMNEAVAQYKSRLTNLIDSNFDSDVSKKLVSLLDDSNNSFDRIKNKTVRNLERLVINNNGETKSNLLQLKTNISKVIGSPESVVDICVLPKEIGNCDNSTERYYYDSKDNNCLVFVYSGCNGNSNNFETLEQCKKRCMKVQKINKVIDMTGIDRPSFNETTNE